jgi:hypothetical protein
MRKETIKVTIKPLLSWGAMVAVLATVLLLGKADTAFAEATFNPELNVALATPTPETPSDYTVKFNLPKGDVNFAGVIAFIPPEWGVVTGDKVPVGADVGKLTAQSTLGLINAACNQDVPVEFNMKNGSIDRSKTISFDDLDENNTRDFAEDGNGDGNDDAIDLYPDFLDRIVDEQPIRRSAGITLVAGTPVLLQFLVFEPGILIRDDIPNDPELGFPSVTFLQNIGDDSAVPAPGVITDFCTPLVTDNLTLGQTPDGVKLFVNPTDGTSTFTTLGRGQRDADGDGYENSLDTCALVPNVGNPRVNNDADLDSDGLDQACDPNDDAGSGGTNSDEDGDGYLNRQDNCPLDANGEQEDNQADEDLDQVGDACDPDPQTENGELLPAQLSFDIKIGAGGDSPGQRPSETACPDCWDENWSIGGSDGGNGGEPSGTKAPDDNGTTSDDGGGSSALPIVIGVVAAVVIIGGGAALFMRRRSSGG